MTTAVCFKCGTMKFGAFNACPECRATPESEDDYATSLAMTEHYFSKDELTKMGNQVSNGEELHIDPEVKWRFIQMLKAEGVGRPSAESSPGIPVETMSIFNDADASPPRRWWNLWRE